MSNQLQSTTGAVFSSGSSFVGVVNLGAGHAISGANGIGGADAGGNLSYATLVASFFDPANAAIQAVTDFVSIRADAIAIAGTATLEAFDINGGLLGSATANDVNGGLTLTLSIAGIHSIRISQTSGTIAFDDLTFNAVTPVGAVPIPAAGVLFALGLAALGRSVRRRRS